MSEHLALLAAEGVLVGGIFLLLFRLRRVIGLAPLYLVLGALQYLQVVFAAVVRFEIAPGLVVSPASAVLFPVTTFVVLLTYVERDADETRKLAYGIVISNFALYAVSGLVGFHLLAEGGRTAGPAGRAVRPESAHGHCRYRFAVRGGDCRRGGVRVGEPLRALALPAACGPVR